MIFIKKLKIMCESGQLFEMKIICFRCLRDKFPIDSLVFLNFLFEFSFFNQKLKIRRLIAS